MCCFAGPVLEVSRTKIFARLSSRNTQFLVYQMRYESEKQNAMILPLPIARPAHEDSLRFIDLSGYGGFFEDLSVGFPVRASLIGCSAAPLGASASDLKVVDVGGFVASFVPEVADFERLDPRFSLPPSVWQKLTDYADYGFAVFQLKELAGEPHPMAFEFPTRLTQTFFPTLHIHDGEVHALEEFDHLLYLQHAGLDSVVGHYENHDFPDAVTNLVRSRKTVSQFCDTERASGVLAPDLLVHRTFLRGMLENRDHAFDAEGSSVTTRVNFRLYHWLLPWIGAAMGLTWFLRRRGRLRRARKRT